ncbi:hypothetical protein JG688_00013116, partial [Phytophthora aleatoria]
VALELFNGHLMMVGSPDGHVRVQSLEKLQTPQAKGFKDRAIFTLLDLVMFRGNKEEFWALKYGKHLNSKLLVYWMMIPFATTYKHPLLWGILFL